MWKRDEAPRSPSGQTAAQPQATSSSYKAQSSHSLERGIVNIGKSVLIKGELTGSEDLTIEGQFEGTIQLPEHVLTIGPNGKIRAQQLFAKSVIVLGEVHGNVSASDKVDIRDNGSVVGDIVAPRVAISEGAHFRGSIDMQRKAAAAKPPVDARPPSAEAPGRPAAARV